MKKISDDELNAILEEHKCWVQSCHTLGKRANLSEFDLSGKDLSFRVLTNVLLNGADLSKTDLSFSNLAMAELMGANLNQAKLNHANLNHVSAICSIFTKAKVNSASFIATKLNHADLSNGDFEYSNFTSANLYEADCSNTNFNSCSLIYTAFHYANLKGASLNYANILSANLMHANLNGVLWGDDTPALNLQCPEKGAFIGYKKAGNYIVELLIPEDALRSSATSRKCRCSKAKVISITTLDGNKSKCKSKRKSVASDFKRSFIYQVGETVESEFNPDRWNECSAGIHFFMTRQEAVLYGII